MKRERNRKGPEQSLNIIFKGILQVPDSLEYAPLLKGAAECYQAFKT